MSNFEVWKNNPETLLAIQQGEPVSMMASPDKIVILKFRCNVFQDSEISNEVIKWILGYQTSAIIVRSRSNQLTLIFQNSVVVKDMLRQRSVLIWKHSERPNARIELSDKPPFNQQLTKETIDGFKVQTLFPQGDLAMLDSNSLLSLKELLYADGWYTSRSLI